MKKILVFIALCLFATATYAQSQIMEVKAGDSKNVSISVSNGISSDFLWTKPTDANSIITTGFPLTTTNATTSSQTFVISGTAAAGQTATIRVTATAVTGTCPGAPAELVINVVTTPTFTASIATNTQGVCQNSTAADISVLLQGPVGSTIVSFSYYIDANNNGTQDLPAEATQTVPVSVASPTTQAIAMAGFSTATAGTQAIRVIAVNGTVGVDSYNSPQVGVLQTITINALPTLGNFSF